MPNGIFIKDNIISENILHSPDTSFGPPKFEFPLTEWLLHHIVCGRKQFLVTREMKLVCIFGRLLGLQGSSTLTLQWWHQSLHETIADSPLPFLVFNLS